MSNPVISDPAKAGRISGAVRMSPEARERRVRVFCERPDLFTSDQRRRLIEAMTRAEQEATEAVAQ